MLFAAGSGDGFIGFLLVMSIGIRGMMCLMKRFDSDGAVKDATKKGLVSMIGRWLK
jgi:hypothetical protein